MKNRSSEVDRFIHQIVSPLTSLQSAVDLLAHHYSNTGDQRLTNLIGALQRSAERLRQFSQQVTKHAQLDQDAIVVRIPVEKTHQPESPLSPLANPQQMRFGTGLAVLVGDGALDAVAQALNSAGLQVERVATCAAGIDAARLRRPRLLVFSSRLTDSDPVMCAQIVRTDPETSDVVVAIAGSDLAQATGVPTLHLNQPLPEQLMRLLDDARQRNHGIPRILLVDDEPDICAILGHQLTIAGFVVVTAQDGATALRIAAEQHVDLIILDRMLPDGDGLHVLRALRASAATQMIPVILLSAVSALDEKVRSLQLGADDYVVKPCSAAELAARIRSILRRSEREGNANPISRLPGNVVIEQVIRERIASAQPFAVGYIDLDNFKGYNDHYGFFKGDAVILHTARLLAGVVRDVGKAGDFFGHIGGDDFVLVTTLEQARRIGQMMIERFDATIPFFYSAEDRERGYLFGFDRQGCPCRHPLLSLSIAVVPVDTHQYQHPYEIASRAAIVKRQSKAVAGSSLLIDSH